MPQHNSISLTWQTFGCISLGRGNMATAAFFGDFQSPRLKPSFFPSPFLIPSFFFFFLSLTRVQGPRTPQRRFNTILIFSVLSSVLCSISCSFLQMFLKLFLGSHLSKRKRKENVEAIWASHTSGHHYNCALNNVKFAIYFFCCNIDL